jgi:hypothetical protein
MTIKSEVFEQIIEALNETSAYSLFEKNIGLPEEHCEDEPVALMWNLDEENLMVLHYANPSNGWAKIAEQQNPWILLGYFSGYDCIDGDPFCYIAEELAIRQKQY